MDSKLDPLMDFRWVCTELPLGHDVTYVEEIELPFPEISPKEGLFGAGTYTYYPAFEDISAFDVTFYEDSKLNTSKWLREWQNLIRRPEDGAYFLPGNYKFDIKVDLLDTTGATIGTLVLKGAWPTSRGSWPLAYGGNDRLKIQQNFSCDNLDFQFT
jgi:hypothetical protein